MAGVAQPWVTEGPKPSVCRWLSLRHLTSNWLKPSGHLVILLFNTYLLPLFFHLFTQVHLWIDGSVEGQYITQIHSWKKLYAPNRPHTITVYFWFQKRNFYTYGKRWGTIPLNYNLKMEFLQPKRLGHEDGYSRLIPKPYEPLEETVIATLRLEIEIKSMLCNTIQELPVTTEIKSKAKINKHITEKKKQIIDQQYKKIDGEKIFSICDGILMHSKWVVIPGVLKKKNIKRLPYQSSQYSKDESFNNNFSFGQI